MLNTAQNNRALKDYLYNLQIDIYDTEGLPQSFHNTVKANITFTKKLNDFKQLIDCLSGDRCFKPWVWETEEVLEQSERYIRDFAYQDIAVQQFIQAHQDLAIRILELAGRIYEGHWAHGVSKETDQQFYDLTEFCRRIWLKESQAWVALARAWLKRNQK